MAKLLLSFGSQRNQFYVNNRFVRPITISKVICCSGKDDQHKVKKPRVKSLAVRTYLGFVDRYVQKFEKRFQKKYPKAFKIYILFKDGVSLFFKDSKVYYQVSSGLWYGGKCLEDYTYHQLDVYRQIPSDMLRVAPVLLISMLPFANYVVFPVAYMFPRHLLCRHFWTSEQQVEYSQHYLHQRRVHYSRIRRFLLRESDQIQEQVMRDRLQDLIYKNHSHDVFSQTGSDLMTQLLDCKPLFENQLSLDRLYSRHRIHMQWRVAHSWGFPGRKPLLVEQGELLLQTDRALGVVGVGSLSLKDLQQACFYRGVDASLPSQQEMQHFLNNWLLLSGQISGASLSLLLHTPVLLGLEQTVFEKRH